MSDQLSSDLASLKIARDDSPPRRGLVRALVLLGVLGGLAAAGYFFLVPYLEARLFKTEVRATEVSLVSPAQASIQLASTGYVVPQTVSKVGAKVAGRISKMRVRQGDRVKAGDVVAELEMADVQAAVAAARSRVMAARARAQTARANLAEAEQQARRERTLAQKGVSPEAVAQDLEARARSLEEAVRAADAETRAAQAEVDSLSVSLGYMTIVAPIDGTVMTKPVEVGELVGPQTLAPVLELADLGSILVETDVAEARLHMVKIGGPTEIVLDAFPDRRYRGQVREISPRVDRAKATVTVKVAFVDPAEGVLPEMAARTSFLASALDAAAMKEPPRLVIPAEAVADRGGGKVVFVLDAGKVRMTPVTLGPALGGGFVVEAGPPAGTRLVKNPPAKLADGQSVKEKND